MFWVFPFFFSLAQSARFGTYFDAECKVPIINAIAFTDVCTWSSNRFSGSYALTLTSCSDTELSVKAYNLTGSAGCNGESIGSLTINSSCIFHEDNYVQAWDFNCNSQNNSYNIIAHFTPDCQDGGYAFSMDLGQPQCNEDSFAPGLWDWDAQGSYSDPYYMLELFNTTDGTCQDQLATFQTKEFPAWCLPTVEPFQNISIDIYPSFPLV